MRFDGLLIDLDGVIWRGGQSVPNTAPAVRRLIEEGTAVVFLTNNPRADPAERAERLAELGIPCAADQVVTAGQATLECARRDLGDGQYRVYVTGNDSFRRQAHEFGFELVPTAPLPPGDIGMPSRPAKQNTATAESESSQGPPVRPEEIDAVIVSGHVGFDYAELKTASDAVRAGARLYAPNRDTTGPMPDGLWPGTGAILAAVEAASGTTATVCGKPGAAIFETALTRLSDARATLAGPGARIAMVGDRLISDIQGAALLGLETVLVLSGETSRADLNASDIEPDHVLESIADL